jgi:hypothetical protein
LDRPPLLVGVGFGVVPWRWGKGHLPPVLPFGFSMEFSDEGYGLSDERPVGNEDECRRKEVFSVEVKAATNTSKFNQLAGCG